MVLGACARSVRLPQRVARQGRVHVYRNVIGNRPAPRLFSYCAATAGASLPVTVA
jgi:hypothetical protein